MRCLRVVEEEEKSFVGETMNGYGMAFFIHQWLCNSFLWMLGRENTQETKKMVNSYPKMNI